jgi:hypothetical protein
VRHNAKAPVRYLEEVRPQLLSYVEADTSKVVGAVTRAKGSKVVFGTGNDAEEDRVEFLMRFGFNKKQATAMLDHHLEGEGRPADSVWDMAQAITGWARSIPFQDERVATDRV